MRKGICDCCAEEDVILHRVFYNGLETFGCAGCLGREEEEFAEDYDRDPGPSEAEIARSQALIEAVLGPEEIAKLKSESHQVIDPHLVEARFSRGVTLIGLFVWLLMVFVVGMLIGSVLAYLGAYL